MQSFSTRVRQKLSSKLSRNPQKTTELADLSVEAIVSDVSLVTEAADARPLCRMLELGMECVLEDDKDHLADW